ncbi:galactosyl transferase [Aquamicrobium soli]|uniref:Galactosyl transferase n=1 Tax=Aquamicrobium soli TaxID=1811518 RepID=A0ABV7K7F4_9HYPH
MTMLTFIIPVRHQDNARDWGLLRANLSQTAASIASQAHPGWRALVVANEGADLPPLPRGFDVVRVTFPPNDLHEMGEADLEAVYDAFRADKGRRVLAGMLAARDSRFFMIVDDDDFVSARIAGHVAENPQANGWTIERGYIWDDGGRLLLGYDEFNHLCGTSLIVRADLYGLPDRFEDASLDWIKTMLGSHVRIADILAGRGTPLVALPFRGAVYRVAHGGSHSKAPSLVKKYFLSREALARPRRLLRHLARLRLVGDDARREFFGAPIAGRR